MSILNSAVLNKIAINTEEFSTVIDEVFNAKEIKDTKEFYTKNETYEGVLSFNSTAVPIVKEVYGYGAGEVETLLVVTRETSAMIDEKNVWSFRGSSQKAAIRLRVTNTSNVAWKITVKIKKERDDYKCAKASAEIRSAGKHFFYLLNNTSGYLENIISSTKVVGFAPGEPAKFRRWKITVWSTLDKPAKISIHPYSEVSHVSATGQFSDLLKLYSSEEGFLTTSGTVNSRIQFMSLEGGDALSNIVMIPALDGIYTDLAVILKFAEAPTVGVIYIALEAQS